jgi:hypothetical protein
MARRQLTSRRPSPPDGDRQSERRRARGVKGHRPTASSRGRIARFVHQYRSPISFFSELQDFVVILPVLSRNRAMRRGSDRKQVCFFFSTTTAGDKRSASSFALRNRVARSGASSILSTRTGGLGAIGEILTADAISKPAPTEGLRARLCVRLAHSPA